MTNTFSTLIKEVSECINELRDFLYTFLSEAELGVGCGLCAIDPVVAALLMFKRTFRFSPVEYTGNYKL